MSEVKTIKIMIVDDHDILRHGVALSLEIFEDIEVVGLAGDGAEAIEMCRSHHPDVILMDLMMPGVDGVEATRTIRAEFPQTQVVALTSFEENNLVYEALNAGAISYLLKNVSIDELSSAIRNAYQGKSVLSKEASDALINIVRHPIEESHLTPREREVLDCIVKGMSNSEIAEVLSVSASTAKKHVTNILAKLDVSNRAQAVAVAMKQKLV
jgi:two-component system, NarL family, response regulator LiaR